MLSYVVRVIYIVCVMLAMGLRDVFSKFLRGKRMCVGEQQQPPRLNPLYRGGLGVLAGN